MRLPAIDTESFRVGTVIFLTDIHRLMVIYKFEVVESATIKQTDRLKVYYVERNIRLALQECRIAVNYAWETPKDNLARFNIGDTEYIQTSYFYGLGLYEVKIELMPIYEGVTSV